MTVHSWSRAHGATWVVDADAAGGTGNEHPSNGSADSSFGWLFDASTAPPLRAGLNTIPPAAETGWSPAPSPRRVWIARAVLLGILLVQAALSLRLHNGAFEDEALYLYAGHLEIAHLLHGTSTPGFVSFFSGSPVLYPVLAAAVDAVFGLGGARALSLLFMLGATALLYALTRLLFNERAALCAAAIFAVCPSTIFMGNFATYDSAAILLLALASWIVIRTRHLGALVTCLLAAPVLALVVAVKYASLLFVPTVAALAVLAAFRGRRGWSALSRGVLIPVLTGAYLAAALLLTGTDAWQGVRTTTTARAAGTDGVLDLLGICARWAGPPLAVAAVGAVLYIWRDRMGEVPDLRDTVSRRRWWRILLALLLCGSAVLAPAHHMQLHTAVSLHKHIGYGLLFAAPLAGVGLSRVVGAHFRHPQFGILIWVAVLMTGITLSRELYLSWPDPQRLVAALQPELAPGKRYLVENSWPPQYYLRGQTEPWQWTSTYAISYSAADGRALSGRDGYLAALDAGHFDVIVLDGSRTPGLDEELIAKLRLDPRYRLLGVVPYESWTGTGNYRIWVKNPA